MTENDRRLLKGMDPNDPNTIALVNAIEARPVPAIEKPLGGREVEQAQTEFTLIDLISEEGLKNIGDAINGRNPWEY